MLPAGFCRSAKALPMHVIPAAETAENEDADECENGEQGHAALPMRQDEERRQQWAERRAEIAADLKHGLCKTMLAAGCQARDARRLRMEDRGTKSEQDRAHHQNRIVRCEPQRHHASATAGHAEGK